MENELADKRTSGFIHQAMKKHIVSFITGDVDEVTNRATNETKSWRWL